MDFKQASDRLFDRISHEALANALDISVASVRQSRLGRSASAYRAPPKHWRRAVLQLAEERIAHYQRLIEELIEEPESSQQILPVVRRPIISILNKRKGENRG